MKAVLILFTGVFLSLAASAQTWERGDYRKDNRERLEEFNSGENLQFRMDEVNRIYDHRVWEVKNDFALSNRQKRKMIHEINEEREDRIKAIQKWGRKEARERRRNDDDRP